MNHWDRVIGINLLTKFHENKTINVASRVLTRKNAPPPADRNFQPIKTILVLVQDIMRTNLLTTFHDDQTINLTSRVLTRKNAPPPWQPCFSTNQNHFRTHQTIHFGFRVLTSIETNLLTILHQDWTIHVASRVLTRKILKPWTIHVASRVLTRKILKPWTIHVASRVLTRKILKPHYTQDRQKAITKAVYCAQVR
ncbi:hypothetical protein DPMN_079993 [Dreissena polymorpha]|uniref:Uncharacterized protein n=1 Tax=Dreissena polymorpha TaxID=45954 RepID=A0A9D3YRS7_DREPO|nr:hypothetical protein DPMN_079993 [Dreissena polymorpha]